jgi:hypothetical protein
MGFTTLTPAFKVFSLTIKKSTNPKVPAGTKLNAVIKAKKAVVTAASIEYLASWVLPASFSLK